MTDLEIRLARIEVHQDQTRDLLAHSQQCHEKILQKLEAIEKQLTTKIVALEKTQIKNSLLIKVIGGMMVIASGSAGLLKFIL